MPLTLSGFTLRGELREFTVNYSALVASRTRFVVFFVFGGQS